MATDKAIWFETPEPHNLNKFSENTASVRLGIEITEVGADFIKATMPVDDRTHQPLGILHGGASVLLAETLASLGANFTVDPSQFYCVGQEINANHIRSAKSGLVTGITKPLHIGRSSHVWEVKIYDEADKLVCVSRMTAAVLKRPNDSC